MSGNIPFLGQRYGADIHVGIELMRLLCPGTDWVKLLVVPGEPASKSRPRPELLDRLRGEFPSKLDGTLAVACVFYRSNRQRIDVDNMVKNVLDSATGTCWHDDSQVTAQAGFIEFSIDNPRTILAFGPHRSTMDRTGMSPFVAERFCVNCAKGFHSYSKAQKFCSPACASYSRGNDLSDPVHCPSCMVSFKRRTTSHRFCSNDCRLSALASGNKTRGPLPTCRCGKQLSRHGYLLCRDCWRFGRVSELAPA